MATSTTAASVKAHTSTLRLSARLLTLLSSTDTPEAADLARTVSAERHMLSLDTLARVGGLVRVPPADLYRRGIA